MGSALYGFFRTLDQHIDIRSWSKNDLMDITKSVTIQGLLLNSYMAVTVGFCSTPADYVKPRKESKIALEYVPARTPCHCFLEAGRKRCQEYEETEVT